MRTPPDSLVHSKMMAMRAGERVIASDAILEAIIEQYPDEFMVRSAINRHRCGIQDGYVCWIADSATPADLEFRDGYAVASV